MSQSRGILYITGSDEPYFDQAIVSCQSAKLRMPDIQTAIVTDHDNVPDVFDHVINKNMFRSFKDKPEYIDVTPFDRTLFVDTDTYFVNPIHELWDLLDYYDVAATFTTHRRYGRSVPVPIPEYNTGVILFEKNGKTRDFFKSWRKNFGELGENERNGRIVDQPSFRYAVYENTSSDGIKFFTLPPEYNILVSNNVEFLRHEAKILHSKPSNMTFEEVADKLDSTRAKRVYFPRHFDGKYTIRTKNSVHIKSLHTHPKFISLLSKLGIKKYAKRIYNTVS